jgi:hypothetical protein
VQFFLYKQHIAPPDLDIANLAGTPFLIVLFLFNRRLFLLRFLDLPTHALRVMLLMMLRSRIAHPTNIFLTHLGYEDMANPFILIGEEEVESLS